MVSQRASAEASEPTGQLQNSPSFLPNFLTYPGHNKFLFFPKFQIARILVSHTCSPLVLTDVYFSNQISYNNKTTNDRNFREKKAILFQICITFFDSNVDTLSSGKLHGRVLLRKRNDLSK